MMPARDERQSRSWGFAYQKKGEPVPQPLLTSLFLRNSWLLPGFGIMTDYLTVGEGRQKRGKASRSRILFVGQQAVDEAGDSHN